jgi:anti-sigma B factor antagonist
MSFEADGEVLVVRLAGEIDMSNAEDLGSAVLEATPNDALGVILDLSNVQYLDSAGIYVIYGIRGRLKARDQLLRLVVPAGSPVHDALRLAGVHGHGDVVETVEQGVRAARARQADAP